MELFLTKFDKTDQKDNLSYAKLFWTKHAKPELHRARPIEANKDQNVSIRIIHELLKPYGIIQTQAGPIRINWYNTRPIRTNKEGPIRTNQNNTGYIENIKNQSGSGTTNLEPIYIS